jgi:hypothetical protein
VRSAEDRQVSRDIGRLDEVGVRRGSGLWGIACGGGDDIDKQLVPA